MTFKGTIKLLSNSVAAVVVFLMAGGMYLSGKGFDFDEQGNIILVKDAEAAVPQDTIIKNLTQNYVLPDNHSTGNENAPLVLYEYSSFACAHCADFHLLTLNELKKEYVDKGILRVVFVPFPNDRNSMNAALIGECLDDDKYNSFVDVMFKKQREWGLAFNPTKVIKQYASLSGLSQDKAENCMKNDDVAREILTDRQNAISQLGVKATPTFVLSSPKNKQIISGARPYDVFKDIIDNTIAAENIKVSSIDKKNIKK